MKAKKKEGLSCLFEIAGQKKGLLVLAGLLSAGSAVCMLVPYWAIYEILKELLSHPDVRMLLQEPGQLSHRLVHIRPELMLQIRSL